MQQQLQQQSSRMIWIIMALIIVTALIGFWYYKKTKRKEAVLKEEIDRYLSQPTETKPKSLATTYHPTLLEKLKVWEKSNAFLDENFSLDDLSKQLEANRSEVSKLINQSQGKNFNQYINSLRIQYIIRKLKTDTTLRKSNVSLLAKIAGFKTRQNFSLAFREETGFRPTDFLRNMP